MCVSVCSLDVYLVSVVPLCGTQCGCLFLCIYTGCVCVVCTSMHFCVFVSDCIYVCVWFGGVLWSVSLCVCCVDASRLCLCVCGTCVVLCCVGICDWIVPFVSVCESLYLCFVFMLCLICVCCVSVFGSFG